MTVIPVILSGGSGTRLWPLSRKQYPKQLLNIVGGTYTMLQETMNRVSHLKAPIVVCNEDHRFLVAEQCHSIGIKPSSILLEPIARNTAPAIALAALEAEKQNPDAIIAVFPADHVIEDQQAFEESLNIAINTASEGDLVTFGIVADKPETGFGYIKASSCHLEQHNRHPEFASGSHAANSQTALPVEKFVEKPELATAEQYVESGDYYWNSGMFVFKAKSYLEALEKNNPDIVKYCKEALREAQQDLDFIRVDKASFEKSPDDSIDYAVMETANNVVVVPMDAQWSDLGSWSALWDIGNKDKNNNVNVGDVIAIKSKNNLVHSPEKLVATIGIKDVVIVETQDALLVAHKAHIQDVKKVVAELNQQNRKEHVCQKYAVL